MKIFLRNFLKTTNFRFFSRKNYPMNSIAYFKYVKDDEKLNITFKYANSDLKIDKTFNFCRDINENVSNFIPRIKSNLEKELNKKQKKRKKKDEDAPEDQQSSMPEINVDLRKNGTIISETPLSDIVNDLEANPDDFILNVLERQFKILYNWPSINNISLPTSILAGFYVYPMKLELQFANKSESDFIWFKGAVPKSKRDDQIEWQEIGRGYTYLVKPEDVGFKLKVFSVPKNGDKTGPGLEAISKNTVEAGPGNCPFETRHLFTQEKLAGRDFRVVSYNLLADYYADSDYTRTVLFPYCPPYALEIDYRKQLFMKEILGYNADLICLQEVDGKIFDQDLVPSLEERGLQGMHMKKGTTPEGLAIFYDTKRFEFIEKYGFNIGESIKVLPEFAELWEKIKSNQKLADRICDRSTSLQVVLLKSNDTGKYLFVANTHLYFHPDADHIRLLQGAFSIIYLENLIKNFKTTRNLDDTDIGLIFCGDFNSVPECGIYKLYTEKFVGEDFVDWNSNAEEAVKNVSLTQSFNLQSACGCPQYTNYTHGFSGCLDYIYYRTDMLEVQEVIPLPSDEEVKQFIAIPNVVFPSDHLALVANLKWT